MTHLLPPWFRRLRFRTIAKWNRWRFRRARARVPFPTEPRADLEAEFAAWCDNNLVVSGEPTDPAEYASTMTEHDLRTFVYDQRVLHELAGGE